MARGTGSRIKRPRSRSGWDLDLESLLIRWLHPIEPIYLREVERGQGIWMLGCGILAAVMLGLCARSVVTLEPSIIFLVLCFPLLGWLWRVQAALSASDTIIREVEQNTWQSLRALPYTAAEIIRSKYAGVLSRTRMLLLQYLGLRLLSAGCGFCTLILSFSLYVTAAGAAAPVYAAAAGVAIPVDSPPATAWLYLVALPIGGLYLLIEPALDIATDTALGILVSTLATRRSQASTWTLLLSVAGLGGQLALSVWVIRALAPAHLTADAGLTAWQVLTWGIGGTLPITVDPVATLLFLPALLALRYALLRGLLKLAAWRAESL